MIGYIKGTVEDAAGDILLLDHGGMGFRIHMAADSLAREVRPGDQVKIYTYLHVKEDAMQLYGFFSEDDLDVFKLLLGVNGIGPRAALGILSGLSADELRFAVLSEDAAAIARAPGVGKKTAQKLILELKDKFDLEEAFEKKLTGQEQKEEQTGSAAAEEAVQALVALGYSNTEAFQAVKKAAVSPDMETEAILKAALKFVL
ncbi:MAG TPA: Holliday junction branch migration protein RuvA [Candidatus Scatomonas pullistercoris]|mgnify:FL=1|uniref:Holliday junction branch migration complex subunit RuvA n=1 Tax=Candidatus Scatomonas pullistercoris TaxID=2840920 RepID=A0A9D1P3Z7_9FIRM|nr:Holliday junction branch migration protein RuvA [Candidatus Scatomonas pullistercoris]